jgi:serine/threonine protein phosphatase PrpC
MIPGPSFAASDKGLVRNENEDSYIICVPDNEEILQRKGILAVVADGVGGGPAGKRASSMAVELVRDSYYRDSGKDNLSALRESLQIANIEIYKAAQRDPVLQGMGTTCTAFVIGDGKGYLSHAGDSRAYLLRNGELLQLSEDHTLVNELINEGIISREEGRKHPHRNIIMKALGTTGTIEPDTKSVELGKEDTLFLCSDGLYGCASDDEISSVLSGQTVEEAGRRLIELALTRGGSDNITVVILRVSS